LAHLPKLSCDNDETQIDHEEAADDDEQDEVDETEKVQERYKTRRQPEERVRVHHVVHDVDPAFQTDDLENGNPGVADVVEGDCTLERILRAALAASVVPVPIDTLVAAVDAVLLVDAGHAVPELGAARALFTAHISVRFEEASSAAEEPLAPVRRADDRLLVVLPVVRVQLQLRFVAGEAFRKHEITALPQDSFPELDGNDAEDKEDKSAEHEDVAQHRQRVCALVQKI